MKLKKKIRGSIKCDIIVNQFKYEMKLKRKNKSIE